ncbi:MAG: folate family ECF transporter S component [Dethiobacteria bacterium]|jgi:ECF transporter S component (folate family)|nr:folate family ECF transporter S component [Bacillota bacterium]
MRLSTRQIVISGILVAMSIILTRFASIMFTPFIRVGFGPIPIYISSIVLGPLAGGIVGGIADLLGFWFNTFGAVFPNPYVFLASIVRGILPGLLLILFRQKRLTLLRVFLLVTVTELFAGLLLTTYGLTLIYGVSFRVLLPPRLIATLIQIPIYGFVVYMPTVRLKILAWVRSL